jgi:hypothetical protein
MKNRPSVKRPKQSPIIRLRDALLDHDYRKTRDMYEYQEPRGDNTSYRILPNNRVKLVVRCRNIKDGWYHETMSATEALRHLNHS